MVYTSLVANLIGQRSPDVIGRLSVSRDVIGVFWCYNWIRSGERLTLEASALEYLYGGQITLMYQRS